MKKFVFLFLVLNFLLFSEEKFDWGFDLRIREEYLKDAFYLGGVKRENDNYFRIKASIWGKYNFNENTNFFIRFSGEPKFYLEKEGLLSGGKDRKDDEFVFENLYFEFKKIFNSNFDLKIGRQDFLFQYGEGFVIQDGTPGDGSRTFYFNALKTTYHLNEKNSIDLIFLSDPKEDVYLPVVNDNEKAITNSDEKAFIIYAKLNPMEKLTLEPYYIYKTQKAYRNIDDLDFNTLGIRKVYKFDPWKLRGELAYQWGEYDNDIDKRGYGGYLFLTRDFKNLRFSPSFEIGYIYLSGDDPKTTKDESWDPVFSRWPWLSELYVYYYLNDGEIAKWSNLNAIRTSLNLNLTEKTSMFLCYNYFGANENIIGAGFRDGKTRGHNTQLIVRHKFNPNISGHLWIEHLIPGNFYSDRNSAMFIRWEIAMKF